MMTEFPTKGTVPEEVDDVIKKNKYFGVHIKFTQVGITGNVSFDKLKLLLPALAGQRFVGEFITEGDYVCSCLDIN